MGRRRGEREPRLVFLSDEQYRERFGGEVDRLLVSENISFDLGGWQGWDQPWPPPTVVVVMGEHGGTGLWNRLPSRGALLGSGALEPAVLRLSGGLAARLAARNDRFDAHGTSRTWATEGRAIAREVQRELDARGVLVEVRCHGDDEPGPDEQ